MHILIGKTEIGFPEGTLWEIIIRMGGLWVFSMLACNMALLLGVSEFFIIHIGHGILLAQDRRLYFGNWLCIVHPLRCEYSV